MTRSKLRLTTYGVPYRKGTQWVGPYQGVEFLTMQELKDANEVGYVRAHTKKATMIVKFKHVAAEV